MARVWKIAIVVGMLSSVAVVALIVAAIWTDQQPARDHLGDTAVLGGFVWVVLNAAMFFGIGLYRDYEANR